MTDLSKVYLIGRLTKTLGEDEKAFGYVGQTAKATVSLAVNRSVKKGDKYEDEPNFFYVNIWGKTAENLKPYLNKGTQILIEGSLRQNTWEKDGKRFDRIEINADNVRLLGGKKGGDNNSTSTPQASSEPQQQGFDPAEGFPEDIPF